MILNSTPKIASGGVKLVSLRASAPEEGYTLFYTKFNKSYNNASITQIAIPSDGTFVTVSDVPVCSVLWITNPSGKILTSYSQYDCIYSSFLDINGVYSIIFTIKSTAKDADAFVSV